MAWPARLGPGGISAAENVVRVNGRVVGLLNPGVLVGFDGEGLWHVCGPVGRASAAADDPDDMWAAIVATGAVLLGDEVAVKATAALLRDDRTSRTASYFCSKFGTCSEVLRAFSKLRGSVCTVVGCGGIGSLAAVLLAGAGFGALRLIDPDRVERSNLNRQILWTLADLGKPKVDVLQQRLQERFPGVKATTRQDPATPRNLEALADDSDAVLLTADEPLGLVKELEPLLGKGTQCLVSCGYFLSSAGATIRTRGRTPSNIQWERGPWPVMPSFGPTNAELAGLACALLIDALTHEASDYPAVLDAQWNTSRFPRRVRGNLLWSS
jgi:hypothetical protein